MRRKIFKNMCILSLLALILSSVLLFGVMYGEFYDNMKQEVRKEAWYIGSGIETGGENYLDELRSWINYSDLARVTLIRQDGAVLFDNFKPASTMENHLERPEVQEALATGQGEELRLSATMQEQTFYYALLLKDGSILRIASTTDSVLHSLFRYVPFALLIIIGILLLASALARQQTKRIVMPINGLDLDHPLENDVYEELSPLLGRISKQNELIHSQMEALRDKQKEFTTITENMKEGLILLNAKSSVLFINNSAIERLGAGLEEDYTGRHILVVNRSPELQQAVEQAEKGVPAEASLCIDDRCFQLITNPVMTGSEVTGMVVLVLDVTEKQAAEQMRREFSANVSHELKTPLQSISGYAEIIKSGLVKDKDVSRFVGKIYDEAKRLISLVDDIIQLSRLDENRGDMPREDVNLLELAEDVAGLLQAKAEEKQVKMTVSGEPLAVNGIRQVLWEMIYNLCDNAVKYNKEGGRVEVKIFQEQGDPGPGMSPNGLRVCLTVSDTGIGIPRQHQERVFERFYRVDKSHSRETGGTGLGLSIVKHGALCHNATVSLESREGKGTTVRLEF